MKNETYWLILLSIVCFVMGWCFEDYLQTRKFVAENCGHRAITKGIITGPSLNGKNENGVDVSCYVKYDRDGKIGIAQKWNVGNCDVGREIDYDYNSYICI